MKRARPKSDELFFKPLSHVQGRTLVSKFFEEVERSSPKISSQSSGKDQVSVTKKRKCKLCDAEYAIGSYDKTTSTLRSHLEKKHLEVVLKSYPKPTERVNSTAVVKKPSPFGYTILVSQETLDRAVLMRFIANGQSYSSLKDKGNQLFHETLFPELIMPNKELIKNGCNNLWESVKQKLKDYIQKEAPEVSNLVSTIDIWSDDNNQAFLGLFLYACCSCQLCSKLDFK